jgi:hypothetical protein
MSPSDLEQVSIPDTLGILRLPAYTCLYCITLFLKKKIKLNGPNGQTLKKIQENRWRLQMTNDRPGQGVDRGENGAEENYYHASNITVNGIRKVDMYHFDILMQVDCAGNPLCRLLRS